MDEPMVAESHARDEELGFVMGRKPAQTNRAARSRRAEAAVALRASMPLQTRMPCQASWD
jgi:hypothetical protein